MATAGNQRVMVAVRVRPVLNEGAAMQTQEKFELPGVYRVSDNSIKVELTRPREPTKSSVFNFDYIFDQESTQLEVYEDAVVDMIDAALVGVNATLLAYGQTGSGKTFSILGDVKPNPLENDLLTANSGMFLRILSDLIEYRQRQFNKGWHVVIGLSCVEIYNENIRDLFGGKPDQPPPPLKAVMIGDNVLLPSLIIREMTSLQAVFNEIQLAISRRKSRATDSNSASSRSHCLFSIDILQQSRSAAAPSLEMLDMSRKSSDDKETITATSPVSRKCNNISSPTLRRNSSRSSIGSNALSSANDAMDETVYEEYEMPFQGTILTKVGQKEPIYWSKIILADLAGSERITRSHVSGEGLTEATSINSSLTALGNVVHSLHEGSYASYRTSNLTALLKPTFSHPSSRVMLLAQCSPTQLTFDETISTLHFANKVKAMKVTTVTGAEAEKLQFDYIEAEKMYDAIAADLHIFATEMYAAPTLIRRTMQSTHNALHYNVNDTTPTNTSSNSAKNNNNSSVSISSSSNNTRERKAYLDSLGITALAQQERNAILRTQEKDKAKAAEREEQELRDAVEDLVNEERTRWSEVRDSIRSEQTLQLHQLKQQILLDAAAVSNYLSTQEEVERMQLTMRYGEEHYKLCHNEFNSVSSLLEHVVQQLSVLQATLTDHESTEWKEANVRYANAAWLHCIAKRLFADCMELREEQMCWLSYLQGNTKLERWQRANRRRIEKVLSRYQQQLKQQQQQQHV